jgi:hypothetical protein
MFGMGESINKKLDDGGRSFFCVVGRFTELSFYSRAKNITKNMNSRKKTTSPMKQAFKSARIEKEICAKLMVIG